MDFLRVRRSRYHLRQHHHTERAQEGLPLALELGRERGHHALDQQRRGASGRAREEGRQHDQAGRRAEEESSPQPTGAPAPEPLRKGLQGAGSGEPEVRRGQETRARGQVLRGGTQGGLGWGHRD